MLFVILSLLIVATSTAQIQQQHIYDNGDQYPQIYPHNYLDWNLDKLRSGFSTGMEKFHQSMDNLNRHMDDLHQRMEDLHHRMEDLPKIASSIEITNGHYILRIQLSGFEEKDIEVKTKQGYLMVKAVHEGVGEGTGNNHYLKSTNLPENVDPAGEWTFTEGVLTIDFKFKNNLEEGTGVWHTVVKEDDKSGVVTEQVVASGNKAKAKM